MFFPLLEGHHLGCAYHGRMEGMRRQCFPRGESGGWGLIPPAGTCIWGYLQKPLEILMRSQPEGNILKTSSFQMKLWVIWKALFHSQFVTRLSQHLMMGKRMGWGGRICGSYPGDRWLGKCMWLTDTMSEGSTKGLGEAWVEKKKIDLRKLPMAACPWVLSPQLLSTPEAHRTRDFLGASKPSLARTQTFYWKYKRKNTACVEKQHEVFRSWKLNGQKHSFPPSLFSCMSHQQIPPVLR